MKEKEEAEEKNGKNVKQQSEAKIWSNNLKQQSEAKIPEDIVFIRSLILLGLHSKIAFLVLL